VAALLASIFPVVEDVGDDAGDGDDESLVSHPF
jgi:hypothetical protein